MARFGSPVLPRDFKEIEDVVSCQDGFYLHKKANLVWRTKEVWPKDRETRAEYVGMWGSWFLPT